MVTRVVMVCLVLPTEDQIPVCFAVEPGRGSVVELLHMPE